MFRAVNFDGQFPIYILYFSLLLFYFHLTIKICSVLYHRYVISSNWSCWISSNAIHRRAVAVTLKGALWRIVLLCIITKVKNLIILLLYAMHILSN